MSLQEVFETPQLRRYPDARRSALPLFDAVLLPYLALLFGSAVGGLVACFNAVAVRRFKLAAASLAAGAVGWLLFAPLVGMIDRATGNVALAMLAGRAMHFVVGSLLFLVQRPYVRGHAFLGGSVLPVLRVYVVALLITLFLPGSILLLLLGVSSVR